jgi:hypothetical protein
MVRLWVEPLSEDCVEIRGEVRHVLSGRRRYVRDWTTLKAFLDECVGEGDSSLINPPPDEPGEAES